MNKFSLHLDIVNGVVVVRDGDKIRDLGAIVEEWAHEEKDSPRFGNVVNQLEALAKHVSVIRDSYRKG